MSVHKLSGVTRVQLKPGQPHSKLLDNYDNFNMKLALGLFGRPRGYFY